MRLFLVGCMMVGWGVSMAQGAVPGRMIQMNFRESPIEQVVYLYQKLKEVPVTLAAGTYATMTLETLRVDDEEGITLIEGALSSNGVQVVVSENGITLSPDPSWRWSGTGSVSVVEAERVFDGSSEEEPVITTRPITMATQKEHFLEYRRELKRQGLPAMPLTEIERSVGITEHDLE